MTTFTIEPRGAFLLRESAMFGFGGRDGSWDGRMRLAFCLDGYAARGQVGQVGVVLSGAHGAVFDLAGEELAAVPTPSQLLRVETFPGIPEIKLTRMRAVARAALDGRLDVAHLTSLDPGAAMREVQELPGIGPFYSALVVIRECGRTDVLPTQEPRALELVRRLHGLTSTPTAEELTAIAEPWRPFRTWATVLIRAAGDTSLARRVA